MNYADGGIIQLGDVVSVLVPAGTAKARTVMLGDTYEHLDIDPAFLRRNEIERLFRRLKGFRRIFSRFDKLDLVFIAFIYFALIVAALRR